MRKEKRNPWAFIPTQYFAEGLPYIIVNIMSVAMFKSLGISNEIIGLTTSLLVLPWSFKPLWSPFIDGTLTKRKWFLLMQLGITISLFLMAGILQLSNFFTFAIIIFAVMAFLSATHDISIDGYYLYALDKKQQALFTGIRSTFYRVAWMFGTGVMVSMAGMLNKSGFSIENGWSISFLVAAGLFAIMFIFHKLILPYPKDDVPVGGDSASDKAPFIKVFKEYFSQEKIVYIVLYILLYRLGEGMLAKMSQPFLMDTLDKGGMGIELTELGVMNGIIGLSALVIGGISGGWAVKQWGLKKMIWPMALLMNVPNLFYGILAYYQPMDMFAGINIWAQLVITIEQFGYGFGFIAFMVFLLYTSKGKYRTSMYAISTGLMALGMMIPGALSGYLQAAFGYANLFFLTVIVSIPGMLLIFKLPIEDELGTENE